MKNKNIIIIVLVALLFISFGFNLICLNKKPAIEKNNKVEVIDLDYIKEKTKLLFLFPEEEYNFKINFSNEDYCFITIENKNESSKVYNYLLDLKNNQYYNLLEEPKLSVAFGSSN